MKNTIIVVSPAKSVFKVNIKITHKSPAWHRAHGAVTIEPMELASRPVDSTAIYATQSPPEQASPLRVWQS